MKTSLFYSFTFIFIATFVYGQKQGNIWMFGQGGGLDFNSGTPVAITGSQVFGNPTQTGDYLYSEGCSSISDSSGQLLFYSNGDKVWNNLNQVMPNGDNLDGFYSSTTAAFAIPVPLSDSLYYLFTTDGIERFIQNGLRYSMIDMCLDNGKGDIIGGQKNILLLDTVSEKLCAIAHPNGADIWVIAHKYFSDAFYAYQITPSGISSPVISHTGSVHAGYPFYYNGFGGSIGQMKASPDGTKIGLVFSNNTPSVAELFDFNSTTGVIGNPISLLTDDAEYGIEFSPDNSKLYITNIQGMFQFDISSGNQSAINISKTLITNLTCLPGPLQLGPDGKIYFARCSNFLGAVNSPNNSGAGCNYVNNSVNISPAVDNTSLPSFIAGYNYINNKIPECSPSGIEDLLMTEIISIYPNPFFDKINITTKGNELIEIALYDVTGRKTLHNSFTRSTSINTEQIAKGIYLYEVRNKKGVIQKGKIVKG